MQGFSNVVVFEKSDRLGGRLEDVELRKLAQPLYGRNEKSISIYLDGLGNFLTNFHPNKESMLHPSRTTVQPVIRFGRLP